jgi:DUF1680 family protein
MKKVLGGIVMAALTAGTVFGERAELFAPGEVRLTDGPFKAMEARTQKLLLSLDPYRLMYNMRKDCGLDPKEQPYGGWERSELAGHTLGHYLSAVSREYAATGDAEFKKRVDIVIDEMARCQERYGTGYVGALQERPRLVLESLAAGDVEPINHCWAPWYTEHKIAAGLLDAWLLAKNPQAKDILIKFADWSDRLTSGFTERQRARMLSNEFGGIGESFWSLYAETRDARYASLARRFRRPDWIVDALAAGRDPLPGKHANTHIPQLIAEARDWEVTGDATALAACTNFFRIVSTSHTFSNGGIGVREFFFNPADADKNLTFDGPETCCTYNMLKFVFHLLCWNPDDVSAGDYSERALFNEILCSQDPERAQFVYLTSLKPGQLHSYSTPEDSFWCCYGTGLENAGRFRSEIYLHTGRDLYVSQFIPSVLGWKERGLELELATDYPASGKISFTFKHAPKGAMTLHVRCPAWASGPVAFTLNGKALAQGAPGQTAALSAEWHDGDRVEASIPMALRTEPLFGGHPEYVAFLCGPALLAGDFGPVENYRGRVYVRNQTDLRDAPCKPVPALRGADPARLLAAAKPVANEPLTFRLPAVDGTTVTLRSFSTLPYNYYNIYWKYGEK